MLCALEVAVNEHLSAQSLSGFISAMEQTRGHARQRILHLVCKNTASAHQGSVTKANLL